MSARLREHTRNYMTGVYTILDVEALQRAVRTERWHGLWYKSRTEERKAEYDARKTELAQAATAQLRGFRIFTANVGTEPRILERLEAAIMKCLYAQAQPLRDIPDRGMMLAPRRAAEEPIEVALACPHLLHGLPRELQI